MVSSDGPAQSFALVDSTGGLYGVHPEGKTPKVASTVKLATHKLANGTLEATRLVTQGDAPKTSVIVVAMF